MKTYRYIMNVKATKYESENRVCLLAANKKEAMRFSKDFKGLKILEKLKGTTENDFKDSESLMNTQKELLAEQLKANKLYIEN